MKTEQTCNIIVQSTSPFSSTGLTKAINVHVRGCGLSVIEEAKTFLLRRSRIHPVITTSSVRLYHEAEQENSNRTKQSLACHLPEHSSPRNNSTVGVVERAATKRIFLAGRRKWLQLIRFSEIRNTFAVCFLTDRSPIDRLASMH